MTRPSWVAPLAWLSFIELDKAVEELYKKGLNDLDHHDSMVTHLEPHILESEVKWALGSINMNKASRGHVIPAEVFKILRPDAVKVPYSICQQT